MFLISVWNRWWEMGKCESRTTNKRFKCLAYGLQFMLRINFVNQFSARFVYVTNSAAGFFLSLSLLLLSSQVIFLVLPKHAHARTYTCIRTHEHVPTYTACLILQTFLLPLASVPCHVCKTKRVFSWQTVIKTRGCVWSRLWDKPLTAHTHQNEGSALQRTAAGSFGAMPVVFCFVFLPVS